MNGILCIQNIQRLVNEGAINSDNEFSQEQFQPNSIDLRLGPIAYRVQSSFISECSKVSDKINDFLMYQIDLTRGAILEKNKIYIIPLLESLTLPESIRGTTNPKSSTGRLDIFTRIITDYNYRFNEIPIGYHGKLYLEIAPRSFTIKVRQGISLSQLRLMRGDNFRLTDDNILDYYKNCPLLFNDEGHPIPLDQIKVRDGLFMGISLLNNDTDIIGFKSRNNSELLDIEKSGYYEQDNFFEPIYHSRGNGLILEPEQFYVFASKERICIPNDLCAEMIPYDTNSGELRTHYAGFFDSGFGNCTPKGAKVVLELRSHDVPFFIEHGQTLFRIVIDTNCEIPKKLYGSEVCSNYQHQGLRLAKQFKT